MKKLITILAMAVLSAAFVLPASAQVYDLDITVALNENGSAHIREVWDLRSSEGTEWYLVRSNLGDIEVSGLKVSENGYQFMNEGSWDVNRSIDAKAGRCGIVRKSNGVEICWGLGSHDRHVFTVDYDMSNVVKSLDDYDMVHMQFVSPGLSSSPQHVRLTMYKDGASFNDNNSRLWGFGYEGSANYSGGRMVFESSESFQYRSSLIALVRFDKGFFSSQSVQNKTFDDVLDVAMEGSSWENEDELTKGETFGLIGSFVAFLLGVAAIVRKGVRKNYMNVIGVKSPKELSWSRSIPYNGDVVASEYILGKLYISDEKNRIAAAIILKLIQQGYLIVSKDAKDKVEISFNEGKTPLDPSTSEGKLYAMMKEASGDDQILQDKEFSRWSKKNMKTVYKWTEQVASEGRTRLISDGWMQNGQFTDASKQNARDLLGLKMFLKDFTLNNERGVSEVALWQDYLVFAALFGVADKVAKELKDINPQAFEETMAYDYTTMHQILWMTNNLSNSITNAKTSYAQRTGAAGGHGGASSFGGGGGFSGGGFGGGAR